MRAINIKWDIDEEDDPVLPAEVEIPGWLCEIEDEEEFLDEVSDWLSDEYGYCHDGFMIE